MKMLDYEKNCFIEDHRFWKLCIFFFLLYINILGFICLILEYRYLSEQLMYIHASFEYTGYDTIL